MMCDEKEYNPQGGSLLACIVTQGRLRCTCQPCAIESITPMGYGHTAWFGAIECAIRWGMNTPCVWRGLSNVQCNAVGAHCVVWWRWVGAVPVCPPVSPHKGASIIHSPRIMRVFLVWKRRYANVRAGTQAPPLRILFGWIACVVLFVGKAVHMNQHHRCCTFVSPGLPTIGSYPG